MINVCGICNLTLVVTSFGSLLTENHSNSTILIVDMSWTWTGRSLAVSSRQPPLVQPVCSPQSANVQPTSSPPPTHVQPAFSPPPDHVKSVGLSMDLTVGIKPGKAYYIFLIYTYLLLNNHLLQSQVFKYSK